MKPKLSVIIPHVPISKALDEMLDRCLASLHDYDELIMIVNPGDGYGKNFNKGFKYATGDYLLAISNDTILQSGSLRDIPDPKAVTYSANAQFGCFFCLPRWVYEQTHGFDESFGLAYYEDNDFLLRLKDLGIPLKRVPSILVDHVGGATVKALGKEVEAMLFSQDRFKQKWGNRDPNSWE